MTRIDVLYPAYVKKCTDRPRKIWLENFPYKNIDISCVLLCYLRIANTMLGHHNLKNGSSFIIISFQLGVFRELRLAVPRVPIHEAPQLHLPKSIFYSVLKHPHVHVFHVMLDQEHIEPNVGLVESSKTRSIPYNLSLGFLIEDRLEIKIEEEPGPPYAISTFATFSRSNLRDYDSGLSLIYLCS
ncbi:hypothetical protein IEQ34_010443 [Dendrobium chrysotoxum]|uniref:Uncharacterized protein n=1 Tax=Dendrobium chrysotoxum TaxID=161865 RepID=A0AAV7H4G6_DENCH|nr:hypothetical protein IEQ34_010443 [Dendrobium chrysotoxum]